MPPSGNQREASSATTQASPSLAPINAPDLRSTVPVARRLIDAPRQNSQTARMGTTPVIRPLVKEPKYLPVSGQKVCSADPKRSGTSIMPPGIRSIERLIFMLSPLWRDARASWARFIFLMKSSFINLHHREKPISRKNSALPADSVDIPSMGIVKFISSIKINFIYDF